MNSDRFGGQTHLILPVLLASVALLAIGFAVAALVGTGATASAGSTSPTLTYVSTQTLTKNGKTITKIKKVKVHTKKIPARTITRDGKVTTLPAHIERIAETTTVPGKVRVTTHTTPGKVTTQTQTTTQVSVSTIVSLSTVLQTVLSTVTTTVIPPPVTTTVTVTT